ncbi:hypothetical protein C8Q76DRAFT_578364, partial [Earliella scabrosa]
APVSNVGSPLAYWRSRSPSPAPSLDIRMPTGLGRRASELGERQDFQEYSVHERKRSISLPASPTQTQAASRWRALPPEPKTPALDRVSPELLSVVFSFASRPDILSLARVSTSFSQAAKRALYSDLDLRNADDERIEQCISTLASRRSLASLVRTFACRILPPPDGAESTTLNTVTFAIALTNMDQLNALTLPDFDIRLVRHATFSLRHLTLLCTSISPQVFHSLFSWLSHQPSLLSLSFPSLLLPTLPPSPLAPVDSGAPSRPHTPRTPDTPSHESDAPSHVSSSSFPPTVVPNLRRFDGPVAIAAAIVPGRPVERVTIPIQHTLYDGLRPSALMSALASARCTLRALSIKPASKKIDQRTLERVVMSAGAELGDFVETLEVHWVLDDEILYKLIVGVLARFRALRTLSLLRDSPPPHPPSPLLEFPLPPASPPNSNRRTSVSTGPPSARSSTGGAGTDTPFPRVHERAHLALWSKTCPTLLGVTFLSGAQWR